MNEILMIITAGLWLGSASAIHSTSITANGVWVFFGVAVIGSVITCNLI